MVEVGTWRVVGLGLVLTALVLGGAAGAAAQDEKPEAMVVEEDLGDGFRAVSINGGPFAVIDDETGMILKQIRGQPAVVDPESGAILFMDDDGEPRVKFYGGKGGKGKGGGKAPDPTKVDRMKAFMQRVQKYRAAAGELQQGEAKQGKGKQLDPKAAWEALVARYLELLGVSAEEAQAIRPLLEAVLRKQDEIRHSTVDFARQGKRAKARGGKTADLPAAIQDFLRGFRAGFSDDADEAKLQQELAAYREARATQDTELETLREQLREVLTVAQESKLTAVGALR